MLIPSQLVLSVFTVASLSRRVNANSQLSGVISSVLSKLIKKGEC